MSGTLCPTGTGGNRNMTLSRTREGYRTYKLTQRVRSDDSDDGPFTILNDTVGLPVPGTPWLIRNDLDIWVFATGEVEVKGVENTEGVPTNKMWDVTSTFSNDPSELNRCSQVDVDDPALEPFEVSVSFIKERVSPRFTKAGVPIETVSHERIRGAINEWDDGRPVVTIKQNVTSLDLNLLDNYIYRTNSICLWGFSPGRVLLTDISLERKFYGICFCYYTRTLQFEINGKGFNRRVRSEGQLALRGEWVQDPNTDEWSWELIDNPDKNKPSDFIKYVDTNGNLATTIHDDDGKPFTGTDVDDAAHVDVNYYDEQIDFLQLGIPAELEECSTPTNQFYDGTCQ